MSAGATPQHFAGEVEVRPSLLAALDVMVRIIMVFLPFIVPLALSVLFFHRDLDLFAGRGAGLLAVWDNLALLAAFFGAFGPALRLAFTRYVLDDEGVRIRTQILSKSEQRVPWEKVTALRHRRTLVDRMLGIERLDIVAYGRRGATLALVGLRDAAALRDMAARRMRAAASASSLLRSD